MASFMAEDIRRFCA